MMKIKGKPDLDAFISGAEKETPRVVDLPKQEDAGRVARVPPPQRVQKNLKLRKDLVSLLEREAFEESQACGFRVTEASIIEELLEQRYSNKE